MTFALESNNKEMVELLGPEEDDDDDDHDGGSVELSTEKAATQHTV